MWFNRPAVTGRELDYMREALAAGHISGDGGFTKKCHAVLEAVTGAHRAMLTPSCTHALEMAALLLGLGPGDEVICPPFTFVSTVNAIVLRGARPVFVDVRPDTLNIDERAVEAAVTPRTRAIMVVHYAGVACEMDVICDVAARHGLVVVEDNAHGLFAAYRGRPLGSIGALATLSFHETKNITCGEGGALLVNDPGYVERAEIIREKGTNRSRFFRGQVDRYTWVDIGSSYLPSDLLAAYLLAQIEARQEIQRRRHAIWAAYAAALPAWAQRIGARLPVVPAHCEHPAHLFYMLMPSLETRSALIEHMKQRQVLLVFHYQPLHLSDVGLRLGGRVGQHPVAERVADMLVRLPIHYGMSDGDVARVIEALEEFGRPA
ncbi:MAG: dTDP-4-amino-4,6-dideoxygalactose transaminase [Acidobacteriota bacterium]